MSSVATHLAAYNDRPAVQSIARNAAAAPPPRTDATPGRDDPRDTVDLSDRAKATLARAKSEQMAADKLTDQVSAGRESDKSGQASTSQSGGLQQTAIDPASLFARLSGQIPASPVASSLSDRISAWGPTLKSTLTVRNGPAPFGDPTTSDAQFIKDMSIDVMLTGQADAMDAQGFPAEIGRAMRAAIANGTLKIQDAAEVDGLNMQSTQIYSPSAIGGPSTFGTTSQHPVGAIKEALDQGKAVAVWTADRGNVYITWPPA